MGFSGITSALSPDTKAARVRAFRTSDWLILYYCRPLDYIARLIRSALTE
jgi:hypothetical protein